MSTGKVSPGETGSGKSGRGMARSGMTERIWLNRVIALAEQFGWAVWHVAAPMRAARDGGFVGDARAAGLPDLILIYEDPPRMILAELKGTDGKLSDAQQRFLLAAKPMTEMTYAFGVYCWFPEDEAIVERILRSKVLR